MSAYDVHASLQGESLQGALSAQAALQGILQSPALLNAILSQGQMIINDYIFTITETGNEYTFTARRGSEIQTMTIYKGGGNVHSMQVLDIVVMDKAEYDALPAKNPTTQYLIRG